MEIVSAVRLQRLIVAYAVGAMVVVGVGVAAASILPLKSRMAEAADHAFEHALDLQVGSIGETIGRMGDLARQVTSRSVIRDALAAYNRGQTGLEDLRAFTADKLADSMKLSPMVLGITRLGPDLRPLVSVGKPIPDELWSSGAVEPPALGSPRQIGGIWMMVVSAPIRNREGGREGVDILLIDASGIRAQVGSVHNLGESGEVLLGRMGPKGPELFFPRRDGNLTSDGEVATVFAAAGEATTRLNLTAADGTPDVALVEKLPAAGWVVMARQSAAELHHSIDRLVMMVAAGVAVLILLAIAGFLVLLRPLTGRILIAAGDLRRELDERQRAQAALERALESTIEAVASTIEMRDPYTAGHQRRVAEIAVAIGRELGLDEDRLNGLRVAGTIHDIGKIAIPAEILTRPGRIGPLEMDIIRAHAADGCDILKGVDFPWPVTDMVRHHHERMDGSGYPDGLCGDEILMEARILAVADVVEAIASDRPYRAALGIDVAMSEIQAKRGTAFDERVVDACRLLVAEGRLPLDGERSIQALSQQAYGFG